MVQTIPERAMTTQPSSLLRCQQQRGRAIALHALVVRDLQHEGNSLDWREFGQKFASCMIVRTPKLFDRNSKSTYVSSDSGNLS